MYGSVTRWTPQLSDLWSRGKACGGGDLVVPEFVVRAQGTVAFDNVRLVILASGCGRADLDAEAMNRSG